MSPHHDHPRAGHSDEPRDLHAALAGRPEITTRDDNPLPPEDSAFTRRTALKMFSVTAMMGAVAGCTRKPKRNIYSIVERPEYLRPGVPLHYASTWTEGTLPYGIMVKCIDGRPIKIEGHPDHPLNAGKSSAQMQAALTTLYDPERLRSPKRGRDAITWADADQAVVAALRGARSVVLVTRSLLGPSERDLLRRFTAAVPGARHVVHEPAGDRVRREAWARIYGAPGEIQPRLEKASVVVSLDCDFLGTDGDVLANTRAFASTRRPQAGSLSRLYVAEGGMSVTGSNADHRLPVRPAHLAALAEGMRQALGGNGAALAAAAAAHGWDTKVLDALVGDLGAHQNDGTAVVLAGAHLPAAVHASVARLNEALGNARKTLRWNPQPATLVPDKPSAIRALLEAGPDVAIFLGVNPVYDLPGAREALAKVKLSVGHGLTENETLAACSLALPSAHNLESWNDAAPRPGVVSWCQPMIAPLFDGRQEADSLLTWAKAVAPEGDLVHATRDFHDYVRHRSGLADKAWEAALRAGLQGTPETQAMPKVDAREADALVGQGASAPAAGSMDVVLVPHSGAGDGRFGGNGWLLETPEPVTQMVWDNAAILGPAAGEALGVTIGDWVEVAVGATRLQLPVVVKSGFQKETVVVHLGLGRTEGAGVGAGAGFNAYPLVEDGERLRAGASVTRIEKERYHLVRTQRAHDQMDREIARSGTAKEYAEHPTFALERRENNHGKPWPQIDQAWDYSKGHKWALAIDLNQCTGCNACMVACQAENNVPIVGKGEVSKGRDMSWIRIDRYEAGDAENPAISNLPMLCQHCDNAPCETVCPVNATTHSPEGLNEQVYNRCVGTRYCANNCPYKVRRFNFFNFTRRSIDTPVEELAQNPHVTVRMRGVMEKCTFCIQRINAVKFEAKNKGAELPDGAIVTACQQACPADAIVFGDANVPGGAIAKARGADLAYHVLEELNVRPNVTYQARVRNPHPSLDSGPRGHGEHEGGHK